ncbi:RDD family protein [Sulfurospirillum deleyianum]|uniref:RDD domain containing protein n=1 Tax=Sulfurospirillum deleyianum (strain ATCC 51133 / DSM 6946 / 5175) TaxID=525898 RepID=D1B017_SULD5|nr:RDD family protein [Sulfurospirillum deleyianum]ACZ11634.1 RDD domain containing protein [Sulfurospirillum deleyianum DSM 6946]
MTNEELIEKFERENISLATLQKRGFAYAIDEILISLLFAFIYIDQIPQTASTEEMIEMINGLFFYVVLLKVIYQTFFVWMYGATLGRIAMKIRVISTEDLEKPSLLLSLSRASFRIISESIFYLGFVWAALNPKRETWHDKVANTLVVNAH